MRWPHLLASLTTTALTLVGCDGASAETEPPALDWSEPARPTAPPDNPLPPIEVSGAELRRAGRPIRLRGVNVCSLEFDRTGSIWQLQGSQSLLMQRLVSEWHVNALRVPLNQQWFLEDDAYVDIVERLADDANRLGLYLVLDLQWEQGRQREPYHDNILPRPTFGPGLTSEAFWHKLAGRFDRRTNLLYDLLNEPHDDPPELTRDAMARLAGRIRQRHATVPLVLSGPDWSHSVAVYADAPVELPHIIYSAHQYEPYDSVDLFEANFLATARHLPVLLGEFGITGDGRWQQALLDRAEGGGVDGWFAWAIGCGLLVDDPRTAPASTIITQRLADHADH